MRATTILQVLVIGLSLGLPASVAMAQDDGGCGREGCCGGGCSCGYNCGCGRGGADPTPSGLPLNGFESFYMTLRSRLDLNQLAGPDVDPDDPKELASAWGWTDPTTSREYALVARRSDLAIVDITDPDVPVLIGNVQRTTGTLPTIWRDVRVVGDWAYIGVDSANHGIQAFDLTRVRGVVTPTLFTADHTYMGVSNSHSLGVNLNTSTPYVYAAGANTRTDVPSVPSTPGGLQILNVTDPSAITTAASYQLDGYIHESTVFTYNGPDVAHLGKEIVLNNNATANINSFSIIDATDKSNVVRLGDLAYANTAYSHQAYLTEDHRFVILTDELDEVNGLTGGTTITHVIDVSDLDNPVYKGFYSWNNNNNIDHNLYIANGFIYQANYTRGIRIFKIDDLDLDSSESQGWMHEVAWLDTFPANDGQTFNGAWQVYPYFASGSIIVSDINGGLFVVNHVPEPAGLGVLALCSLVLLRRRR